MLGLGNRRSRTQAILAVGLALAASVAVTGMQGCTGAGSAAGEAFVRYYDATEDDLRAYYAADPSLTPDQLARRLRAVDDAGAAVAELRGTGP